MRGRPAPAGRGTRFIRGGARGQLPPGGPPIGSFGRIPVRAPGGCGGIQLGLGGCGGIFGATGTAPGFLGAAAGSCGAWAAAAGSSVPRGRRPASWVLRRDPCWGSGRFGGILGATARSPCRGPACWLVVGVGCGRRGTSGGRGG